MTTKSLSLRQLRPEHLIPWKGHFLLHKDGITSRPEFGFVSYESFLRGIFERLLLLGLAVSSFTRAPTKERLGLDEELSKVFVFDFLSFSSFSSSQFSVFSSRSLFLCLVLLLLCFPAIPATPAIPEIPPEDSFFPDSGSLKPLVFEVAFLGW